MAYDFIGIYEDAFSKEFCERSIKYFDNMQRTGFTTNRQSNDKVERFKRHDDMLFAHDYHVLESIPLDVSSMQREFNDNFWDNCYSRYSEEYSVLKKAAAHGSYAQKMQKTPIGGGYHDWHFESMNQQTSTRILTWILYLNDVEEGGETEFLYFPKRVKPKQGTVLICPAAFTHTHRGNPPISNTKYIITGWVEY
jgi:hypothetical protein